MDERLIPATTLTSVLRFWGTANFLDQLSEVQHSLLGKA
jgi:hypothetical protein